MSPEVAFLALVALYAWTIVRPRSFVGELVALAVTGKPAEERDQGGAW